MAGEQTLTTIRRAMLGRLGLTQVKLKAEGGGILSNYKEALRATALTTRGVMILQGKSFIGGNWYNHVVLLDGYRRVLVDPGSVVVFYSADDIPTVAGIKQVFRLANFRLENAYTIVQAAFPMATPMPLAKKARF